MKKLALALMMAVSVTPTMAFDLCQQLPPNALRQEPNVPYTIKESGNPAGPCHAGNALSCSGRCKTGHWTIWIDRDFTALEKRCVIMHEKAHLPPNNWKANHRGSRSEPLPMGSWQPDC
jgi:hypothetical protein